MAEPGDKDFKITLTETVKPERSAVSSDYRLTTVDLNIPQSKPHEQAVGHEQSGIERIKGLLTKLNDQKVDYTQKDDIARELKSCLEETYGMKFASAKNNPDGSREQISQLDSTWYILKNTKDLNGKPISDPERVNQIKQSEGSWVAEAVARHLTIALKDGKIDRMETDIIDTYLTSGMNQGYDKGVSPVCLHTAHQHIKQTAIDNIRE